MAAKKSASKSSKKKATSARPRTASASKSKKSSGTRTAGRSRAGTGSRTKAASKAGSTSRTKRAGSKRTGSKTSRAPQRTSRSANVLTDHEEIRQWVESHSGTPASVKSTGRGGEEAGILRIDFPGGAEGSLEQISWEEFFNKFDEKDLALLTGTEDKPFFTKFVSRQTAARKTSGRSTPKTRSAGGRSSK